MTTAPEGRALHSSISFPLELYPGMSPFALDLVRGDAAPRRFLCAEPRQPSPRNTAVVDELVETNRAWGNDVSTALVDWQKGDTLTIIAGQQVGFGGGPLYTLAKIASMLRLRRDLPREGRRATVFFWLATEDHDYDEVSALTLWQNDEIHHLRATERPKAPYPVGGLAVPKSLSAAYRRLTDDEGPWLRDGITFGESFASLAAIILRGHDVVLVDSLLPAVRRAGRELFLEVVDRYDELQEALTTRASEIRAAGYTPQVAAHESGEWGLLHLLNARGEREALQRDGASWRLGETTLSTSQLRERIGAAPERVSTGALLRPLLQDLVFATSIFVGGPAEVSYYAQSSALHSLLRVPLPEVQLRGHALVAPERRLRFLAEQQVRPETIFRGAEAMLAHLERGRLADAEKLIAQAREALQRTTAGVDAILAGVDQSVRDSVARTERHLRYHVERLAERTARAIARRDGERFEIAAKTSRLLAPEHQPQDRLLGWISFWHQYGERLVERLVDEIEPNHAVVRIVGM